MRESRFGPKHNETIIQRIQESKHPGTMFLQGYTTEQLQQNIDSITQENPLLQQLFCDQGTLTQELYTLYPFYSGKEYSPVPNNFKERLNELTKLTNKFHLAHHDEKNKNVAWHLSKAYRRWCNQLTTPVSEEELSYATIDTARRMRRMHWFARELRELLPPNKFKQTYNHLHTRVLRTDYFLQRVLAVYDTIPADPIERITEEELMAEERLPPLDKIEEEIRRLLAKDPAP